MSERPHEILSRCLQETIAAERAFESQLRTLSREVEDSSLQPLFAEHAEQTRGQHEQLSARLEEIGGTPLAAKSPLAYLYGIAARAAEADSAPAGGVIQDLIVAFAVESAEIAMYESLAVAAMAAGDSETEQLARRIQEEERAVSEKIWRMLGPAARLPFEKLTPRAA